MSELLAKVRAIKDKIKEKQKETPANLKVFKEFKNCPKCKGTLQLPSGKPCKCRRKLIVNNLLRECGVPSAFFNVNFEFYNEMLGDAEVRTSKGLRLKPNRRVKTIDYLTDYIKLYVNTFENRLDDGRGFIISGNTGCAKTGAAILLLKELVLQYHKKSHNVDLNDRKYTFMFLEANDLLDMIFDSWDNESSTRLKSKKKLAFIRVCDFLVIDDMGAEYSKNDVWLINVFLKILKKRKNENKPTLITTNYSPEQMVERFSEEMFPRLASVLTESMEVIIIDNPDDVRDKIADSRSLIDDMKREVDDQ